MKKAILTGATSGLGKAIAQVLSGKNIPVVGMSRTGDIKLDLTKDQDIDNAIKLIKEEHSDMDVLILNSGILHRETIGEIEHIDDDFKVNVTGSIKLVNGVLDILRKNKGDIVFIGSTCSFKCYNNESVYNATKHAVNGFIKALQIQLKKEDVRVIGFHPGGFYSPLQTKDNPGLDPDKFMKPADLAVLLWDVLKLPRNMEVSEIIINRKVNSF